MSSPIQVHCIFPSLKKCPYLPSFVSLQNLRGPTTQDPADYKDNIEETVFS